MVIVVIIESKNRAITHLWHGTRTASSLSAAFALAAVLTGPAKPKSAKTSPRLSII